MKWNIHIFDTLKSTNETAFSYEPYSVIIAKEQTAGRGRCGRSWLGEKGNLYMSVVLHDYQEKSPLLAFVTGVSVAEALSDFQVRLKWPNDILLNGKKLAGILLEREEDKIIAGIGVNVAKAPQSTDLIYPVTSLEGKKEAQEIAQDIIKSLTKWLEIFEKEGFEPVRLKWMTLAEGLNRQIEVKLPCEKITGRFVDISSQGAILLETEKKTIRQITAGDVRLL